VRLPEGVFAPYADIPTNILFFDRSKSTDNIWFYEHPLPEGRKKYTKTKPFQYSEFEPLLSWWGARVENECAWKVQAKSFFGAAEGRQLAMNFDLRNPNATRQVDPRTTIEILSDIKANEQAIIALVRELKLLTPSKLKAGIE